MAQWFPSLLDPLEVRSSSPFRGNFLRKIFFCDLERGKIKTNVSSNSMSTLGRWADGSNENARI